MWQEIIVAICVIAAAYFLVRQWLPSKNSSSCGGCGGCNTTKNCATPKTETEL
jgi:hypothetical protein